MDPRAQLMGMFCALAVVMPLALWIGSLLLRAGISLTNKIVGGSAPSEFDLYVPSGYRQGRYSHEPDESGLAVPMPSTGRAMGILLLIGVVDFIAQCGIMMSAGAGSAFFSRGGDGVNGGMAALITIPVSFVIHLAMLSSLLPTTLGRAFLVLLFQYLILFVIVLLLGLAVGALLFAKTGMH